MAGFISTRPERTSDEIAADRKAATTFFRRLDRNYGTPKRNTARLVAFYAYDWKLICCVLEAVVWGGRVNPTSADRAEKKAAMKAAAAIAEKAVQIPPRGPAALKAWAHPVTRRMLPATAFHTATVSERLDAVASASRFWRLCRTSASFRARLERDQVPFAQWLAEHPYYGPLQPAPEHYTGSNRLAVKERFKKGTIRPAGMSYDRALEIAMRSPR